MPDTIGESAEQTIGANNDADPNTEENKEFDDAFGEEPGTATDKTATAEKEDKEHGEKKQGDADKSKADSPDTTPKDSGKGGDAAGSKGGKTGESKEAGEPGDKADKGLTDEKLTAQQKLERRAQEIAAAALDPDEVKAASEKPKKPGEEGKAETEPETELEENVPELSKSIKDLLDSDDLKSAEIDTGKEKISLKKFSEQYPEVTQQAVILARAMAKQASDELRKELLQVRGEIAQATFWQEVQDTHPDAKKIVKSKGYDEWLKQQTKLVQRMDVSPDPEDGIAVLDAYKEHAAKTSKPRKDASATDSKKDTDDVLKHSLAAKKTIAGLRDESADEDDFSAGFNAE